MQPDVIVNTIRYETRDRRISFMEPMCYKRLYKKGDIIVHRGRWMIIDRVTVQDDVQYVALTFSAPLFTLGPEVVSPITGRSLQAVSHAA